MSLSMLTARFQQETVYHTLQLAAANCQTDDNRLYRGNAV